MKPEHWPALDGIPDGALQLFAIFDHPLDFPNHYVVRRQFGIHWADGMQCLNADGLAMDVVPRLAMTLAEARALVPHGLYRQPRQEGDDAFLVECWF